MHALIMNIHLIKYTSMLLLSFRVHFIISFKMRAVYLFLVLVGVAHGAMPQQRSPVYPSATTVGAPVNNNQVPFKPSTSHQQQQIVQPTSSPMQAPQVAQPRDGNAPVDGTSQAGAASNVPGAAQVGISYFFTIFIILRLIIKHSR
jgi:hypothetical protein